MTFSISFLVPNLDPYQPPSFAVGLDMGVSGWYQGRYGKCHVIISYYHIFCCNMFVFASPIIAKSQCWLFALRANSGQISVFALKYPYLPSYIRICPRIQLPVSAQWSQRLYVKVQGKMMHNDMHKIVFQSN